MAVPINNNQVGLGGQANQPKPQGSGFTNLQNVLNANRNNKLGNTLGQGLQSTIGGAQQNLSQATNQFNTQANANAVGTAADKAQEQQAIGQATSSPNDLSQSSIDAFNKYRAGYQGPTGFSNQQQQTIGQQQNDLNGIANASLSQQGRGGLLQRYVGAPQYTQGQRQLDTMLLGQSGNEALKGARRQGLQFNNQANTQQQQAVNTGQALNQQAQAFNNQINQDLTGAATGVQTGIQNRADQEQAQAQKAYDSLQQVLNYQKGANSGGVNGGKSGVDMVGGGVPQMDQATYDYLTKALGPEALTTKGYSGIQDYLKTGANPLNPNAIKQDASNYVNADDVSKFGALQKLAAPNQELISGYNIPGQAGTMPNESRIVDQNALNKAVEQGGQGYQQFTQNQLPQLYNNLQQISDFGSKYGSGEILGGYNGGALNNIDSARNFINHLGQSQHDQYSGWVAPQFQAAKGLLSQYDNYQNNAPTLQDILKQGLVKS